MGYGGSQFHVAHSLTTHFGVSYLYTASVANYTFVADGLEFATIAFPVLGGSEDPFAEKTFSFWPKGSVVDGLRLLDLTVGPIPDTLRGGQHDADGIEFV
tara:strand:- start:80 stop:379 length:300 start_codon:yes stop_codon:yes gene_type:complete